MDLSYILAFKNSLILIAFLFIVGRITKWLFAYYKKVKLINKIKGLPMTPLIGNTQMDFKKSKFI